MQTRYRSRTVAVLIALAVVGALLPIAGTFYVSWRLAVHDEQVRLEEIAGRTIQRARSTVAHAAQALQGLDAHPRAPCSPEHIAQMRLVALTTTSVEEIGYFRDGMLACTSWGMTDTPVPQATPDFTTSEGVGVTTRMHPLYGQGAVMMALQYQSYNALMDPVRLADIVVDEGVRIAVANDAGDVLGTLNDPSPALLQRVLSAREAVRDDEFFVATASGLGYVAVASEAKTVLGQRVWRQQTALLALGLVLAVCMVGLVAALSRRRLSLLGELGMAVRRREFSVHYQPILDLATGRCVGAEALVRWFRPDGTSIRPDLFIPVAEEGGLVPAITDQVVARVIADLRVALVRERDLHIAINVAAEDIQSGRILDVVTRALDKTGIEPAQIWLEATERGFMDVEAARATITRARASGHRVAIDDFGTGYSSLSYLQDFPMDVLKIDKSFIDTIGMGAATSSVTAHIIDMAKSLGLELVAEGVETQAQADYLREHGVDYAQGWLYAKAMPAEDFLAYCRSCNALPGRIT